MKRFRITILAAFVVALLALPATAFADSYTGDSSWTVTFTTDEQLVDTYSAKYWADDVSKLEPGDDLTITVTLIQEHPSTADWYMANEAIKSLEEAATWAASGSAYEYVLNYSGPGGDRTLYDSAKVGGDSSTGLHEATDALKQGQDQDMFYLDTLAQGQTAKVTLKVALDGETEGNAYFDTIAQLKMKFGVEIPQSKTTTTRKVVKTGDDTNLFPFFVAMAVSGVALLGLGIASIRARKRNDSQGTHAR